MFTSCIEDKLNKCNLRELELDSCKDFIDLGFLNVASPLRFGVSSSCASLFLFAVLLQLPVSGVFGGVSGLKATMTGSCSSRRRLCVLVLFKLPAIRAHINQLMVQNAPLQKKKKLFLLVNSNQTYALQ